MQHAARPRRIGDDHIRAQTVDFVQIQDIENTDVVPARFQIASVGASVAQHVEHVGKPTITCTRFDESGVPT